MLKQSSSERIRKNPRCKAVKGCPDRALILSWKGKPICARHYGRWKRTGKLGAAGRPKQATPKRSELNARCAKNLERIRIVFGEDAFHYAGCAPGKFVLFSSDVRQTPTIAIPAFMALERRGLLQVDTGRGGKPVAWVKPAASA